MQFTDSELSVLNEYLNGEANLPVEIEAINVKLREHFAQDNSVIAPEVEAAVAEEVATEAAPAEVAPEAAPAVAEPVEAAPVDAPVADQTPTDAAPVIDNSVL